MSDQEFERRARAPFDGLHASEYLAGFRHTQLTDTMQQANGLLHGDRSLELRSTFFARS